MRVIQVTERYPPAVGGVETHVLRLSQELRKLGVDVDVLTTDLYSTSPLVRFQRTPVDSGGISVTRVGAYPFLPLPQGLGIVAPGMLRHLRGASIVHAHGYGHFPTYLAGFCRISRLPMVATTHSDAGTPSFGKTIFDLIVPRLSIRLVQRNIAISNHERRVLIARGVSPERIVVIPNGVDVDQVISGETGSHLRGGTRTIMYSGRIDIKQKGLDLLIEAFARLSPSNPQLELVLMGPDWDGSTRLLKEMSNKLGIGEKVHFLGFVERTDYLRKLRSADLFVLPSRFEPFGIVLLEAMASGVPIVASRVGAIPEILEGGRFGRLFDAGDVNSLVRALRDALSDEHGSERKSEEAKGSLDRYSWPKIADATLGVYRDVLSKSP